MDHRAAVAIIGRNVIFLNEFIKIKTLIPWGFLGSFERHITIYTLHCRDIDWFHGSKHPPYSTYSFLPPLSRTPNNHIFIYHQIFLPVCTFSFSYVNHVFHRAEVNFNSLT
jgi:hypothetical protein